MWRYINCSDYLAQGLLSSDEHAKFGTLCSNRLPLWLSQKQRNTLETHRRIGARGASPYHLLIYGVHCKNSWHSSNMFDQKIIKLIEIFVDTCKSTLGTNILYCRTILRTTSGHMVLKQFLQKKEHLRNLKRYEIRNEQGTIRFKLKVLYSV